MKEPMASSFLSFRFWSCVLGYHYITEHPSVAGKSHQLNILLFVCPPSLRISNSSQKVCYIYESVKTQRSDCLLRVGGSFIKGHITSVLDYEIYGVQWGRTYLAEKITQAKAWRHEMAWKRKKCGVSGLYRFRLLCSKLFVVLQLFDTYHVQGTDKS